MQKRTRIVIEGPRGQSRLAQLCRREDIAQSLYYSWSKEFIESDKKRLTGGTEQSATTDEVITLKREARNFKKALKEQMLEHRPLKKV